MEFQNPQLNESCLKEYQPDTQWLCLFIAYSRAIELIETPTFFAFYLPDLYQARADGIIKTDINQFTELEKEWIRLREHQTLFGLKKLRGLE